ncbi:MAG: CBS domain containing-hemolysin-like protein [Candidatus Latescibacterota bacterium]|jgi:CBS domain containing-hemolysin-like protein
MMELAIIVFAVVLTSAVCSLFEAILYSVPVGHIETLVQEGRASGLILQRLRKEVDRPIAAILSLNTIANTAGAAVAGAAALEVFGHAYVVYFSAVFTFLILMFSEVFPKTAGVVYSRQLSGFIARPLQLLVTVMSPLVWFTRKLTGLISKGNQENHMSEDELRMMIRLSGQTGTLAQEEVDAITNIISMKTTVVEDVMTPRIVIFSKSGQLTIGELREEAGTWTHGRIPIYDKNDEDIIGVVHRRQVLTAIGQDKFDTQLSELMHPVHFVPDDLPLDQLLRLFLARNQHMFVVLGEFGGVSGVVTLEDVLENMLGQEIVDEFDDVVDMRELAKQRRDELVKSRHRDVGTLER